MSIEYGDEPVTLIEIDQPLCSLTYGNSPCSAQLGVTETKKCYNTRFTCQDPENYDPGLLTLKFSFPQENIPKHYGYAQSSLARISTSPLRVNIGSMDPDASPFGERETVRLEFTDHLHSDLEVDPYRTERPDAHGQTAVEGFQPYDQGTFWGKWMARNPFHEGYPVRIKEGKIGDGDSSLRTRHYLIDKIDGPNNGKITIHCKDLFSLIEERKSEAPVANTGELDAGITAVSGSLVLSPSGIGDDEYSNSGHIAVGNEIMEFTRPTGSDTLTLVTRGDLNTTASNHDAEDQVQEVLVYDAQRVDAIISDLLTTFTEITADHIPSSEWSVEAANNLPTLYTAHIAKPTPVIDLIAELAEQVGFTLWPDIETDLINLKAVGVNIVPVLTVDDDSRILADSITIERDPDLRVSRAQVYFGLINPLEDLEDEANYRSFVEVRDVNAEEDAQYGTKSIRKVFSRWIPATGRTTATTIATLILNLFRDPPFRATFDLDIQRAGELAIASPFTLQTRALVNDQGAQAKNALLPMSISRGETTFTVEGQKLNLFEPIAQERIINIDNDVNNVNLRDLHDSLYSPAVDGDEVTVIVASGVVVGADPFSDFAMTTGEWPSGVTINLVCEVGCHIEGSAGNGGYADLFTAQPGTDGGSGLEVLAPINLTNNGIIGAGGGGGAGKRIVDQDGNAGAAGGGGGAGTRALINFVQPGGGLGGSVPPGSQPTSFGANGSLELGGEGGDISGSFEDAGDGGDLGQAGENGTDDGNVVLGGSPGNAIDGDSLVTHLSASGDIRGAQIN